MFGAFRMLKDRRILVVDDSEQITLLLKEVFTECGASVTVANSGLLALSRLQSKDYDLVVLDLVMPAPNGLDILGFIIRNRPEMIEHTILLTGDRHNHESISEFDDAGVCVVFKPFSLQKLNAMACRLVKRAKASDAA